MLILESVTRSFGGVVVADSISMELRADETVAIIGPNGAGKTSLFNLICGVHTLSEGSITFGGRDLVGLSPFERARLGLGRAFQHVNLFESMTVRENLMLAALVKDGHMWDWHRHSGVGYDATRAHVDHVLSLARLQGYSEATPDALSYGDQKRLDVAIALSSSPQVLLLDEPTAGMSLDEGEEIMSEIIDLGREEKVTIYFIEHDMDMVVNYADRVVGLDKGRVIADGRPEEVMELDIMRRLYF